ncbi:hypothetical protein CPter291_1010 [Collimonas pratensis]|uniref:Uncharacterized protein n=1 Tax=Collimonas pratensis TaxID=279113 RepID=A0ABM5Z2Q0_9BURK|nr:hypothetical protein CPter291_1010 [Collimonas pratensis]
MFVSEHVREYVESVTTSCKCKCLHVWREQEMVIGFYAGFPYE